MSNDRITMSSVKNTVDFTIDCTDPAFAKDANCLVYEDQESTRSEVVSTQGGNPLVLFIFGGVIVLLLICGIALKICRCRNQ